MQITVTDHNDWEGEDFSFVLEVDETTADQIKDQEDEIMEVELNTNYNQDEVSRINNKSNNGYMDRIEFYKLRDNVDLSNAYENVFYKGTGLILL